MKSSLQSSSRLEVVDALRGFALLAIVLLHNLEHYNIFGDPAGQPLLHPFWRGIDLPAEALRGYTVRAWMSGHLYPEKPTGTRLDFAPLEAQGITDLILNEPEVYLDV